MALKTVLSLKDSVAGILSGLDLTNVADLNPSLERAASVLIQSCDIPEASGTQNITLYSGVLDYLCDPRIFGTSIKDIRPQGISRSPSNFVQKQFQDDFDRQKGTYYPSGTTSTFEYVNGVPVIRILYPFPQQKVVLDAMNSTTGWIASGSASALIQDTAIFYQSPASLRFTLTGNSDGTLTKTINPINLSSYQNVGVAFLAIEIPSTNLATDLTEIDLQIGSDNSNYSDVDMTTGFLGSWTVGNWLLVAFDFSQSTDTGTPDWSKISFLSATLYHGTTITNMRVGGLWISQPTNAQILYKSAAIFVAQGSTTASTSITANTDTITLTDPAYNIYLYEGAQAILENTGASASDATAIKINQKLHGVRARNGAVIELGLYDLYRGDNPSQILRSSGSWYDNGLGYGGAYPSNY